MGNILRSIVMICFFNPWPKVRISEGVTISYPYRISIGRGVTINEGTNISGYGNLKIGNDVLISHRVTILSSSHEFNSKAHSIRSQGISRRPTVIGNNVWIGAGAIILGGISIGDGSVIGAGSVVTRDIPEDSIVAGVPAKKISER